MSDSIDNGGFGGASADFGGSVEAAGGIGDASGIGGGNSIGGIGGNGDSSGNGGSVGSTGGGDFGLGGPGPMSTSAVEFAALSAVAGAGLLGAGFGSGWSGASLGVATAIASSFGVNLSTAMGHLATDIANSEAWGGMSALGNGQ